MRLFEFTSEEEHEHGNWGRRKTRVGKRCMRCGGGIPPSERETFEYDEAFVKISPPRIMLILGHRDICQNYRLTTMVPRLLPLFLEDPLELGALYGFLTALVPWVKPLLDQIAAPAVPALRAGDIVGKSRPHILQP